MVRKSVEASHRVPCTNAIESCPVCKAAIWKYNLVNNHADIYSEMINRLDHKEISLMLETYVIHRLMNFTPQNPTKIDFLGGCTFPHQPVTAQNWPLSGNVLGVGGC